MPAQTGAGKYIARMPVFPGFLDCGLDIDGGLYLLGVKFQRPVRQLNCERQGAVGLRDRRLQLLGGLLPGHSAQILVHHIDIGQNGIIAGDNGGIAECAAGAHK